MKRLLFLFSAVFLLAPLAAPQNLTTVTATIVDPNGFPYSNARVQAQLVPTGTAPSIGGAQIAGFTSASADMNGTFSMNLGSNAVILPGGTQWQFTVNEQPGIPPPAGTGSQSFTVTLTISGASENISTLLNVAAPALARVAAGATIGPIQNVVSYGAVADWRTVGDLSCTNSSATSWTSATINMTQADVGKKFWAVISGTPITSASGLSQFTVATVTSSTTWTSTEVTSGSGCSSPGSLFLVTDNSIAFNNAELAIHNGTKRGVIYYPCGEYGVAAPIWSKSDASDRIMYLGGGAGGAQGATVTGCTVLHISPNVWGQVAGQTIFNLKAVTTMKDIEFSGDNVPTPAAATQGVLFSWQGDAHVDRFAARNFSSGVNSQILCQEDSDNFYGADIACKTIGGAAWQFHSLDSYVARLTAVGCPGADIADLANSVVVGGTIAGVGSCSAMTSVGGTGPIQNLQFNTVHFTSGGTAATPIVDLSLHSSINDTSFINPIFDNSGTNNQVLLRVGANTSTTITGATLHGTGTTPTITNNGLIRDACGNSLGASITGTGIINNCAAEPSLAGRCLLTSAAGPLACGQTSNGRVAVPATTTSYTINTTAPVTGSVITIVPTTDNSGIPGAPACGAEVLGDGTRSATVGGTSFTFTQASAAVIKCYDWSIR